MYLHPDLLMTQFHSRQEELIKEADRQHVIAILRRRRRRTESTPAARGRPDGTLTGCGPRAVAPAR